ncbi:MAG TPA: histidinol dehydrogenase, partial [Candidatus Limnocylindria bacterium]|nr:histidinol dehydrogenase [Candidatus Limnocylindria bacterium]
MNVLRHTDPDFAEQLRRVTGTSNLFDKTIEERTRAILDAIYTRGDAAVLELTEKFDGAKLTLDQLTVTQAELMAASLKADESLRAAVATAGKNIERFSRRSLRRKWSATNAQG